MAVGINSESRNSRQPYAAIANGRQQFCTRHERGETHRKPVGNEGEPPCNAQGTARSAQEPPESTQTTRGSARIVPRDAPGHPRMASAPSEPTGYGEGLRVLSIILYEPRESEFRRGRACLLKPPSVGGFRR